MASKCSLLSHKSFYNREVRGRDAKAPAAQLQKHTPLIRQARKDYKGESHCASSRWRSIQANLKGLKWH